MAFKYHDWDDCVWDIQGDGNYTSYDIISETEGAIATMNVVGYGIDETTVAVKDYSENEGMMEFLDKHELIKGIVGLRPSGFVVLPIVQLDVEKLKAMGVAKYE